MKEFHLRGSGIPVYYELKMAEVCLLLLHSENGVLFLYKVCHALVLCVWCVTDDT